MNVRGWQYEKVASNSRTHVRNSNGTGNQLNDRDDISESILPLTRD